MIIVCESVLRSDGAGDGSYGASRGSRDHRGIDFLCEPESFAVAPTAGKVTKLGYCYSDDLSWRYVEITDDHGFRHRLFYVLPAVQVGDLVMTGDVIGACQDIREKYPHLKDMRAHIHFEIMRPDSREYVDPDRYYSQGSEQA